MCGASIKPCSIFCVAVDASCCVRPYFQSLRRASCSPEAHACKSFVRLQGKVLVEGSLADAGAVNADESFWTLENDAEGRRCVVVNLVKATIGYQSWNALLEAEAADTSITHRVCCGLVFVSLGYRRPPVKYSTLV